MIGGYRKIAAKHGLSLEAFLVHENDEFDYELGYEPVLRHKPPRLGSDRGEVLGAYAVARHVDGRKWLDVMSRDEIEKVRAVSRAATSEYGPWVNHWGEMARKTVARRLFKQLPLDDVDEADAKVIEAGDADADLPSLARPTMSVQEANVAASLGGALPPQTEPPDDTPVEQVDEADWTEAVPVDETGQGSFADMVPESARGKT
jgi:recombination protein RecT